LRTITKNFYGVRANDVFTLHPIGDVHIGAKSCRENLLKRLVNSIAEDENALWLSVGDIAEFINRNDMRFDPASIAKWVSVNDLVDLAKAQLDRYINIVSPIAGKCIAMVEGNHERKIRNMYERDIYMESVSRIRELSGDANRKLALGYNGWIILNFYSGDRKSRSGRTQIKIYIHHGHGGGGSEGSKANKLQKALWQYDADIIIFGHAHNTESQIQAVYKTNANGVPYKQYRYGAYSGTFLDGNGDGYDTYGEIKGYAPLPLGGVSFQLQPQVKDKTRRIKMTVGSR